VAAFYPGFEATNWFALFAPAGTPAAILNRMSTEVAAALKSADVRDVFAKDGAEPVGSTPEQLGAYFREEAARYAKVVKAANLRIE
jgi:tripartite-type tricarboxylate transporter receptor subunit TctC